MGAVRMKVQTADKNITTAVHQLTSFEMNDACLFDIMVHFPKSVPIKKQTHQQLEWPEGEYILNIT